MKRQDDRGTVSIDNGTHDDGWDRERAESYARAVGLGHLELKPMETWTAGPSCVSPDDPWHACGDECGAEGSRA